MEAGVSEGWGTDRHTKTQGARKRGKCHQKAFKSTIPDSQGQASSSN